MLDLFSIGSQKIFIRKVGVNDIATFEDGNVHPVYATFALARDAEWASRLFVLEMKEANEEGIGTFVDVQHLSPAFIDEEVEITATITKLEGAKIDCDFEAKVGDRIIATGSTGQKILPKEKLTIYFESLRSGK